MCHVFLQALSRARKTVNIANFIAACRQLQVPEEEVSMSCDCHVTLLLAAGWGEHMRAVVSVCANHLLQRYMIVCTVKANHQNTHQCIYIYTCWPTQFSVIIIHVPIKKT